MIIKEYFWNSLLLWVPFNPIIDFNVELAGANQDSVTPRSYGKILSPIVNPLKGSHSSLGRCLPRKQQGKAVVLLEICEAEFWFPVFLTKLLRLVAWRGRQQYLTNLSYKNTSNWSSKEISWNTLNPSCSEAWSYSHLIIAPQFWASTPSNRVPSHRSYPKTSHRNGKGGGGGGDTVDGKNPANQLRLVVCPIIYSLLYIPAGCLGFPNYQQ